MFLKYTPSVSCSASPAILLFLDASGANTFLVGVSPSQCPASVDVVVMNEASGFFNHIPFRLAGCAVQAFSVPHGTPGVCAISRPTQSIDARVAALNAGTFSGRAEESLFSSR